MTLYGNGVTNVNALSQLTTIGGNLSIMENSNLSQCCGLLPVLEDGGVSGALNFSNNLPGCNTEIEVLDGGACPAQPVPSQSPGALLLLVLALLALDAFYGLQPALLRRP